MEVEDKEISLIDLLIVIAENLKLLILVPLLVGVAVFALGFFSPQNFDSQAILNVKADQTASSLMTSPIVLDSVINRLDLARGKSVQVARRELLKQVSATVGKDGLLRLDVYAHQATEAQAIANAIIDAWIKTTIPGPQTRDEMQKKLTFAQNSLASLSEIRTSMLNDVAKTNHDNSNLSRSASKNALNADKGEDVITLNRNIVAVSDLQQRYFDQVLSIPLAMQGTSREVIMQSPTLAKEPVESRRNLVALFLALISDLFLVLWLFIRHAWKSAAKDSNVAAKQARLRAILRYR